jgi:thymidylate kinase
MSFFELFKDELVTKAPIIKKNNLLYIVTEGPNGGGKTYISQPAAEMAALNFYKRFDLYTVVEPPPINLNCIPPDINVRDYLKKGMAGNDPREQLALFMMARRQQQEALWGKDLFSLRSVVHIFRSTISEGAIVLSDRGMPSSSVFQSRAHGTSLREVAEENMRLMTDAYTREYLYKYNLVTFIQPTAPVRTKLSIDDTFEGRYPEVRLYAEEIRHGRGEINCSDNYAWVDNDPTGGTNDLSVPASCVAAATLAVLDNRKIESGKQYLIPFKILDKFSVMKISEVDEIRSGNVLVRKIGRDEACVEFTNDMPEVR